MYKLEDFRKLVKEYGQRVDFVVIYTQEAHPVDGLSLKNNRYSINHHRNLSDRLDAAKMLHQLRLPCPLLVDPVSDEAARSFRGMPERLVVLSDGGKVVYAGHRGPIGYNVNEVRELLKKV